jgi:hypothetical protein
MIILSSKFEYSVCVARKIIAVGVLVDYRCYTYMPSAIGRVSAVKKLW